MKLRLLSFLILLSTNVLSRDQFLDKVVGVINEKIITFSELERIKATFSNRKEVSNIIYGKIQNNTEDLLLQRFRSVIIRDKINEIGYIIGDDAVNSTIAETEKRLGLRREDLLSFLEQRGLSFIEYFELIRETEEFKIFIQRIISPLVSITDLDLKNHYLKKYGSNLNASIKYSLVSYVLPLNIVSKNDQKRMNIILDDYRKNGIIPEAYKNVEISQIDEIVSDDLPPLFKNTLVSTTEDSFSKPIKTNNNLHVFFVKKRQLMESSDFLNKKEFLYNDLFIQKSDDIILNWYQKEVSNYYHLSNL